MGHAPDGLGAGHEAPDGHAAAHRHSRSGTRRGRQDGLDHGTATGHRLEVVVPGADPAGQLHGGAGDGAHPQRPGRLERLDHMGQLALELDPEPGLEEVQQPELVDATALPVLPRLRRAPGARPRPVRAT